MYACMLMLDSAARLERTLQHREAGSSGWRPVVNPDDRGRGDIRRWHCWHCYGNEGGSQSSRRTHPRCRRLATDGRSRSCSPSQWCEFATTYLSDWPVKKENKVALVKVKDRFPSKELRERLGVGDITLVLQQNRLWCYGHVLQKEDDDWVKKSIEYEEQGPRPRGRPKRTWREVVKRTANHLNWTKSMLRIVIDGGSWWSMSNDQDGCEWVNVSSLVVQDKCC